MNSPILVACSNIEAVSDLEHNPTQILSIEMGTIGQLRCGDKEAVVHEARFW